MIPDTGPCGTDGMTRDSLRRELDAALARVGRMETFVKAFDEWFSCPTVFIGKMTGKQALIAARSALDSAKEGT